MSIAINDMDWLVSLYGADPITGVVVSYQLSYKMLFNQKITQYSEQMQGMIQLYILSDQGGNTYIL